MKRNKAALAKIPQNTVAEETQQIDGSNFPIVGIGASAGGLEAFTEVLKHLSLDTEMAFVLVQHLDPVHESALVEILARATSIPITEITDNLRVEANHIYIIPPNTSLSIAQGILKLEPRQNSRIPHRPIDSFFESLAQDQRERAIGVILSGTATDGTIGLESIKAEDGITFAQDDSAKYDSMPRSAVAAGCVDLVLSPENIAKELSRIAKHPYVSGEKYKESFASPEDDMAQATAHEDDKTPLPSGGHGSPETGAKQAHDEADLGTDKMTWHKENGFKKILLLLRNHSGVDFSLYKSTTIRRRIGRRMMLQKQETSESYADFLRGNIKELDALYSDVLISVTTFFRNPEAFDSLQNNVFPKLFRQRSDEAIRIWTLGCSTGQEAYSIAMAFVESAEKALCMRTLQVFATDLNNALLDKARLGFYAKSLVVDISPERLRRFFVEEEGGYRIVKSLRERVIFARQNLINDPPFSRMDLISCRNMLIYLEPSLQKKAMPTFHYALKPEGFLFLGASESIGNFTNLFETTDKKHKIYSKKIVSTPAFNLPIRKEYNEQRQDAKRLPAVVEIKKGAALEGFRAEPNAEREADRITINQFAPPGVLINADLQILQFRGKTAPYLQQPSGRASFDVLKMACEGLMLPLRAAINKVKKENKTSHTKNIRIEQNGNIMAVNLAVIPLKNLKEQCFLILFEAALATGGALSPQLLESHSATKIVRYTEKEELSRINELEATLSETTDYLHSFQEQHEAAFEELQAANEEIQSANEELQSINEELETSKEELESANEELITVNEEMTNRNAEMNRLNSDLINLQASTKLPILWLGRDLTIRRFSTQAEKQFNLLPTDVGQPISKIRHNLIFSDECAKSSSEDASPDLEGFIDDVISNLRERECEVGDNMGRWYSLRVRPYMTIDNKVDGAVLVLIDISALKRSERAITAARDYAEAIIRTTRDPLLILNSDLCVRGANESFYSTFKVLAAESIGSSVYDLGNGQWDIPKLRTLLEEILPQNNVFDNFEVVHEFKSLGRRTMLLNARMLKDSDGESLSILLGIQDITEQMYLQKAIERSEIRYRRLFEATRDGVLLVDQTTQKIIDANPFTTELFGYTRDELCGKQLFEIGLFKDEEASHAAFSELQYKGSVHYDDLLIENKIGLRYEVEVVSTIYKEDEEQIIQWNIRDITERKKSLLDEKYKAEAANKAKTEFLANMSHEIRTPMGVVLGVANILAMNKDISRDKYEEMIGALQLSAKSLMELINNVLDITKIEENKIEIEYIPFTFNELVTNVFMLYTQKAHEKFISLNFINSPLKTQKFLGDPLRINQILMNLVGNAVKFTEKGNVTVNMTTSPGDKSGYLHVYISVLDTGIGIASNKQKGIFEKFTQTDTSITRKYGGTGLGLAISKNLAQIMGGNIILKSQVNKGSEFTLHLQLKLADEPMMVASGQKEILELPQMHGCILLAEDYKANVMIATHMLESFGYICEVASNGLEVLDKIRNNRGKYVAVLMDVQMPEIDGLEATKIIRQEEKENGLPHLVIIAMTANALCGDREKCLEVGMDDYISKPFNPDHLQEMLIRHIRCNVR